MKIKNYERIIMVFAIILISTVNIFAQETEDENLYDMDLEALMNIEVTTASKKAQNIDDAPAAIYVVTKEDIKFFGHNNIGEALRMVPGLEIAQYGDQNYEVSARGFIATGYNTSNKILWLIDGRTIYNEILGGVRPETMPFSMDDIERIEIIRGAGSALYGANAFSGIINIITKDAHEDGTHGSFNTEYGNLNQLTTTGSVSGKKDKLSFKTSIGYKNMDKPSLRYSDMSQYQLDSMQLKGYLASDDRSITAYNSMYGSASLQYDLTEKSNLRLSGGLSQSTVDHYYITPGAIESTDYFVQLDYTDDKNTFRAFFNNTPAFKYNQNKFMSLDPSSQGGYLNLMGRDSIIDNQNNTIFYNTMDFEYQRSLKFGKKLSAIVGASYRRNTVTGALFSLDGNENIFTQDLLAGYAQVEYNPIEKLNLVAGGRFDSHPIVGENFNPKIAAIYKVGDKHILRAGWGTATRNPHFFDTYLDTYFKAAYFHHLSPALAPFSPTLNLGYKADYVLFNVVGNKNLDPEKITSYELGYIFKANNKLQLKLDLFYSETKNGIEYGITSLVESVTDIENLSGIFQAQTNDPTFNIATTGASIGANWDEDMTEQEMADAITHIDNVIVGQIDPAIQGYLDAGYATDSPEVVALQQQKGGLLALKDGFQGLSGLYGTPQVYNLPTINSSDVYSSYGAELTFTYIPISNLTIIGNYSLLLMSDNYNDLKIVDSVTGTQIVKTVKINQNPVHKFNLGVKYRLNGLYLGVMFNYMSELTYFADNNRNGQYDEADMSYENEGVFKMEPRLNLNLHIGYEFKGFDFYVSGYNLMQDDFVQRYYSGTIDGADMLNKRFVGGVKYNF